MNYSKHREGGRARGEVIFPQVNLINIFLTYICTYTYTCILNIWMKLNNF